jgi:hypothetical protein
VLHKRILSDERCRDAIDLGFISGDNDHEILLIAMTSPVTLTLDSRLTSMISPRTRDEELEAPKMTYP